MTNQILKNLKKHYGWLKIAVSGPSMVSWISEESSPSLLDWSAWDENVKIHGEIDMTANPTDASSSPGLVLLFNNNFLALFSKRLFLVKTVKPESSKNPLNVKSEQLILSLGRKHSNKLYNEAKIILTQVEINI